jgi:hypothetical protein
VFVEARRRNVMIEGYQQETAEQETAEQETAEQDDGASGAAGVAVEKTKELAHQGGEVAHQATERARGAVATQVDQRSTLAGEQLETIGENTRRVAEQLRGEGQDAPAKMMERAAEQVDRLGSYLREGDSQRFVRDVEDFGRRRPWALAAVGLAIGLAGSRFLKASAERRAGELQGAG